MWTLFFFFKEKSNKQNPDVAKILFLIEPIHLVICEPNPFADPRGIDPRLVYIVHCVSFLYVFFICYSIQISTRSAIHLLTLLYTSLYLPVTIFFVFNYCLYLLKQMKSWVFPMSPQYVPNFLMTSGIGLTPTLTPTTLATIEQSFLELQSGHQNKSWDSVPQSGFVPPVVDPGHSNEVSQDSQDYSSDYSDTEWEPQPKKGRMSQVMKDIKNVDLIVTSTGTYDAAPQRSYRRRNKDEKVRPPD